MVVHYFMLGSGKAGLLLGRRSPMVRRIPPSVRHELGPEVGRRRTGPLSAEVRIEESFERYRECAPPPKISLRGQGAHRMRELVALQHPDANGGFCQS